MKITYEQIKSLEPCYDPTEIGMPENYNTTISEFITEYRDRVKNKEDILWVLCRNEFMTDKELRLFAVWCARQVQHLMDDERSVKALDVAEKHANNLATKEERAASWAASWAAALAADADWDAARAGARAGARAAARDAARAAAWATAWDAARAAARDAARAAAWDVARDAARDAQIDKLLAFFIAKENNQSFDWK